jgi:hypothetical protein
MKLRFLCSVFLPAVLFSYSVADGQSAASSQSVDWNKVERHYISALQSDNSGVRRSALGFIGEYQLTGAKKLVIAALKTDPFEQNRMAAALTLARLGGQDSLEALEFAGKNDESEIVAVFCRSLVDVTSARILAKE